MKIAAAAEARALSVEKEAVAAEARALAAEARALAAELASARNIHMCNICVAVFKSSTAKWHRGTFGYIVVRIFGYAMLFSNVSSYLEIYASYG